MPAPTSAWSGVEPIEKELREHKRRWRVIDYTLFSCTAGLELLLISLAWVAANSEEGMHIPGLPFLAMAPFLPFTLRTGLLRRSGRRLCSLMEELNQPSRLPALLKVSDELLDTLDAEVYRRKRRLLARIFDQIDGDDAYLEIPWETRQELMRFLDLPDWAPPSSRQTGSHLNDSVFLYLNVLERLRGEAAQAEVRPRVERLAKWRPRDPVHREMSRVARGVLYAWIVGDAPRAGVQSDTLTV